MGERIYNLVGDGESATLNEFQEEPFDEEDALQELIARNPGLLAGEQMNPEDPPRWILISREAGIADQADGAARWSLDHVLVDQHAVPTLVEVKRGENREIRRTIVGQMLEYAAYASGTWTAAELRETFEQREEADQDLSGLLGQAEPDHEAFWNLVETNLNAKKLRLLFVADRIPDELATVVEFLNEQIPGIEVLAVEIKQFRGDSGLILVPRVIGRLSRSTRASTPRKRSAETVAEFIEHFQHREVAASFERALTEAQSSGAEISFNPNGVSIRVRCPSRSRAMPLAWLRIPAAPRWHDVTDFALGYRTNNLTYEPEIEGRLESWFNAFEGALPIAKNRHERLRHGSYEEFVEHSDLIVARLKSAIEDLSQL